MGKKIFKKIQFYSYVVFSYLIEKTCSNLGTYNNFLVYSITDIIMRLKYNIKQS